MVLRAYSRREFSDYSGDDGRYRVYLGNEVAEKLSDDIADSMRAPFREGVGMWFLVRDVEIDGGRIGNLRVMVHPVRGTCWATLLTDDEELDIDRDDLLALVQKRFNEYES